MNYFVELERKVIVFIFQHFIQMIIIRKTRLSTSELPLRASPRDIQPLNDRGFGIVGLFKNTYSEYINGIAINRDVMDTYGSVWEYYDIGLSQNDGYYVNSGSFPSNTTYYVTSISWLLQNEEISTILSGKVDMIPGNSFISRYL
jgi:hypothetical protein